MERTITAPRIEVGAGKCHLNVVYPDGTKSRLFTNLKVGVEVLDEEQEKGKLTSADVPRLLNELKEIFPEQKVPVVVVKPCHA